MNPPVPDSSTGTVAVVLAAGLGTRMRSALPKVLHPLCGRPMLAYVLDAWASTADGANGRPPVVVYSRRSRPSARPFAGRATPPSRTSRAGTGDAVRAALAVVPDGAGEILVLSGDVPLVTGADLDAILEARRRRTTPRSRLPASTPPTRPSSAGWSAASSGRSSAIVEAKDATADELDGQRDQRRALRVRCRVAAAPDRALDAVGRRPASCTSPTSSGSPARTAGS